IAFLKEMRNIKQREKLAAELVLDAARNENNVHLEETYNLLKLVNKSDKENLAFVIADIIGNSGNGAYCFDKFYNQIKDPSKKNTLSLRFFSYAKKAQDHGTAVMFLKKAGKEDLKYAWYGQ
ncbi:MAG: hypothetical protein NTY99_01010, partial [DPANN group archaeon]|nr:hypothetical protein [DPANN group archaeon]